MNDKQPKKFKTREFNKVVSINGEGSVEDIFHALCKVIDARINEPINS